MEKINLLKKIGDIYRKGENIIAYLKEISGNTENTLEDILISYDFQAGSYTEYAKNNLDYLNNYTLSIFNVINKLGSFNTILEVGVGEATTLKHLSEKLEGIETFYGFDLSWSRIKYGQKYIGDNISNYSLSNFNLFVGDLFEVPLEDSSIDIVYTSHSIEPNGGKEREALESLFRITKNYLVLLEPSYNYASSDGKERMKKNGYITKLHEVALALNYNVVEYRLFDIYNNNLNPTELIVIKKDDFVKSNKIYFQCPITKSRLEKKENCFHSSEGMIAYPIIDEIPCLLPSNGIVATKYDDFN